MQLQKRCLEMDMVHKKRIQEAELEEIAKESKFKDQMREKELIFMNIKIKNANVN